MSINTILASLVNFKDNRVEDIDYLGYLAEHKYNVYKGGSELGASKWDLIKHDWSKFLPAEWVPYREFFKGTKYTNPSDPNYNMGHTDQMAVRGDFRKAVALHAALESHHDYKYHNPKGTIKPTKENLADWWAVSKSTNPKTPNIKAWLKQRHIDSKNF